VTPPVHRAGWSELAPGTFHDLLRLRIDVFVVEQACAYPELDGRDTEDGTLHVWTPDGQGRPLAYLRELAEPDGSVRIGRVCTRREARGTGLAGALLADSVARHGDRRLVLNAQSAVTGWYARRGFRPAGDEFLDDGIPHRPMQRAAVTAGRPPAPAAGSAGR